MTMHGVLAESMATDVTEAYDLVEGLLNQDWVKDYPELLARLARARAELFLARVEADRLTGRR